MIDIAIIRESYANMLDSQLINIAVEDGHELAPQAFQVLKDEFIKRRLDNSFIESAEQKKLNLHQEKMQRIKESTAEENSGMLSTYILEEKEKEIADDIIIRGLIDRGLDEFDAIRLLSTTEDMVKKMVDANDTKMLVGGLSFFIGVFVTLVTYAQAKSNGQYYIVAWGAILFGGVRFFKGLTEKQKYKRLLTMIKTNSTTKTEI